MALRVIALLLLGSFWGLGEKPVATTDLKLEAARLGAANQLAESASCYKRALALDPHWTDGWWTLGTLAYDLGDFALSRDALGHYLAVMPKEATAWALKGLAEFELGQANSSLADLTQARALGVTTERDLRTLVDAHALSLLNTLGRFQDAFHLVQQLCAAPPVPSQVVFLAGLTSFRISTAEAGIPASQKQLISQTGQAVCDATANRWAEADHEFTRLLNAYPSAPQLHYLYGCFLLADNPSKGLDELKAELSISVQHVPALTQIALEYERGGEPSQALEFARRAVAIDSSNPQAQFALGKALADLRRTSEAIAHLRRALQLSPSDRSVLWALASAYEASGERNAAARMRWQLTKLNAPR